MSAPPSPRPPVASSPLAHEAFRAIWLASIFSNVGTFVQDVGESWLMLSLTRDPLPVAMLTTSFTASSLALLMPAGVMADRWDRRKILLFAQSLQTASAFVLAITTWLGAPTPI
jgi:MFS family permease